jgi:hypothetical protein
MTKSRMRIAATIRIAIAIHETNTDVLMSYPNSRALGAMMDTSSSSFPVLKIPSARPQASHKRKTPKAKKVLRLRLIFRYAASSVSTGAIRLCSTNIKSPPASDTKIKISLTVILP